ncbi:hypothetical protein [Sedimentitalea nanhaiensis]|uniref:Uncharacterized protein n=1 Tax=Sedimentitalea nanhaiensis TaxID=999627 RepID=A0A1I7C7Y6_9RHOB|nr:hypothetical protein [Sedimentitalea nanhaiensis]SFT95502.1 hypothetical protein SAMN05216236_11516 [Sedimentitalea nanhaiensis]
MKLDKLDQMTKVTEVLYLNELGKVQEILAEEARLRGELARLQDQSQEAQRQLSDDLPMRSLGADLLWQGWLNRTQRQLNIELSQVMAKKLVAIGTVRKAFGRQNAVQCMYDRSQAGLKTRERERALEALLTGSLMP